jgi:serine/threonine protein kinase
MEDKSPIIRLPFERIDDLIIQYVISEGHYAIALKAFQESLQRPVFIKLLKPTIENRADWIRRFQQEARICAFLKHPNITEVYRIGQVDQFHYIAMEFIEGFSLKEAGKLPIAAVLYLANQLLACLQYIHEKGVIHRDLKPGNILIDRFAVVKISDFGLAYLSEQVSQTLQGALVGTPAYMAPEQITGDALTEKTDLFSLGAVLYELISGGKAFGGDTYSACLHHILHTSPPALSEAPAELTGFIEQLLEKEPEKRPQNAAACLDRLHEIQQTLAVKPDKETLYTMLNTLPPAGREPVKPLFGKRRYPVKKGVGAAIVLLLVMMLAYWLPNLIPTQEASPEIANSKETVITSETDSLPASNEISDVVHTISDTAPSENPVVGEKIIADYEEVSPATDTTGHWSELFIEVKPWADLYINEQLVDSQIVKRTLNLPPGSYSIVFVHPNFPPRMNRFDLNPGDRKEISWSFLSQAGYLWVEVQPWANVYIDGKFIDSTPLNRPVACKSGDRIVELTHPNLPNHREVVTITRGDTATLRVNLTIQ